MEETYFGKVRLRSSLTNCGLPVLTGRLGSLVPAAPSDCLLPPRRLRTKEKERQGKRQKSEFIVKVNQEDSIGQNSETT